MIPITLVLLVLPALLFFRVWNQPIVVKKPETYNTAQQTPKVYEAKRGEMGAVTLEITPKSLNSYEIVFSTHSVDLDFSPVDIIKLKDDLGNVYDAVSWSGGSGGHHLSGLVAFPEVNKEARAVTLTIDSIENEVLNLTWSL